MVHIDEHQIQTSQAGKGREQGQTHRASNIFTRFYYVRNKVFEANTTKMLKLGMTGLWVYRCLLFMFFLQL